MSRDIMSQDIYCPGTICRWWIGWPDGMVGFRQARHIVPVWRGHFVPVFFKGYFGNICQLWVNFWQLLATFGGFWLLLATFGSFWQLLATFGNFWQLLATFGSFWHSAIFNNFYISTSLTILTIINGKQSVKLNFAPNILTYAPTARRSTPHCIARPLSLMKNPYIFSVLLNHII